MLQRWHDQISQGGLSTWAYTGHMSDNCYAVTTESASALRPQAERGRLWIVIPPLEYSGLRTCSLFNRRSTTTPPSSFARFLARRVSEHSTASEGSVLQALPYLRAQTRCYHSDRAAADRLVPATLAQQSDRSRRSLAIAALLHGVDSCFLNVTTGVVLRSEIKSATSTRIDMGGRWARRAVLVTRHHSRSPAKLRGCNPLLKIVRIERELPLGNEHGGGYGAVPHQRAIRTKRTRGSQKHLRRHHLAALV